MAPKDRPSGPAAVFTGPLEGGDGIWLASSGDGPSLADAGYSEAEYAASGIATSYVSAWATSRQTGCGSWSPPARLTTRPGWSCGGPKTGRPSTAPSRSSGST